MTFDTQLKATLFFLNRDYVAARSLRSNKLAKRSKTLLKLKM